jgi:glycolate oxidase subunit GlcD
VPAPRRSPADGLAQIVGREHVAADVPAHYLSDATEGRGMRGRADALVRPANADEVATVVAWCYAHGVAIVPRGGGTGFAGGAVPDGGVVLSLERLTHVRAFEPEARMIEVEAGLALAHVQRLARENGLLYPVDPGAPEQSQIGGNLATNAGGPHAFKYGVTRDQVTGVEAVLAPGRVVRAGGALRKDVAGYDLTGLLIGSEGTLGVITATTLRLTPAPEAAHPVIAAYPDAAAGCVAVGRVIALGLEPAALEFLDAATMEHAWTGFPAAPGEAPAFTVIAEADGSAGAAAALRDELAEVLGDGALGVRAVAGTEIAELWRWRDGVSLAVTAVLGGKVSEDVCVPVARLGEAVERTLAIGREVGLQACSWGHAGDGNLHSTFLIDARDAAQVATAAVAGEAVLEMALELGGTLTGEHGIGTVKRAALAGRFSAAELAAMRAIKNGLDPAGLFNPGKKLL